MGNGTILANPELENDDVAVTSSVPGLGRHAGPFVEAAGGSGRMILAADGDAGDDTARTVVIQGTQEHPLYSPRNAAGQDRWAAPDSSGGGTTFSQAGSAVTVGGYSDHPSFALGKAGDRLHLVVGDRPGGAGNFLLKVYALGGSGWTLKATYDTGDTSVIRGVRAVGIGTVLYFACRQTINQSFIYDTATGTIAVYARGYLPAVGGGAVLAGGAGSFVMAEIVSGVVNVYAGTSLVSLAFQADVFSLFKTTWGASATGSSSFLDLTYSSRYGFVLFFTVVTAAADWQPKVLTSPDGVAWDEFRDRDGVVRQPTFAQYFGQGGGAVATQGKKVFLYKPKAASLNNTPTDLIEGWFDGDAAWTTDKDCDATDTPLIGTEVRATEYRGGIYYGYSTSITNIKVRRANELVTANTGVYRDLVLNEPNYVDGPEDDTATSLTASPSGRVRATDQFTSQAYYDWGVKNVLEEPLGEEARLPHNGTPWILFDAGANRAFVVDAAGSAGINVPGLNFAMNDTDSWGSPAWAPSLSSVRATSTVSSVKGNYVKLATAVAVAQDELAIQPHWVQLTTGIFRVLSNGTDWLLVDGNPGSPAASSAVTVFTDRASYIDSTVHIHRYARLSWPTALVTAEGYYRVRRFMFGKALTFPDNFDVGYDRPFDAIVDVRQLRGGSVVVQGVNEELVSTWTLTFSRLPSPASWKSILGQYTRTRGPLRQAMLWPYGTPDDLINFEVGRIQSTLSFKHSLVDARDVGLAFQRDVA